MIAGCKKDEAPNTSLEGTWEFVNYRDFILPGYEETVVVNDSMQFFNVKLEIVRKIHLLVYRR